MHPARVGVAGGSAHFARFDPHVHMLSIMMPVYNERERVERAIAEVLDTPLPTEFELIVVDDGSTDGTREILRGGNRFRRGARELKSLAHRLDRARLDAEQAARASADASG